MKPLKLIKRLRNDIVISNISLTHIFKNIMRKKSFTITLSFIWISIFTCCLLILYKKYKKNTTSKPQPNDTRIDCKNDYDSIASQISQLHQNINNVDNKLDKLIMLIESTKSKS